MQAYSDPSRESDPHALPDIEVFELTAREVAEQDEDLIYEYLRRPEHKTAMMNSRDRDYMYDTMIEEQSISGGWFWQSCFPGCMPDGPAIGPFNTRDEALADSRINTPEPDDSIAQDDPI